MIKPITHFPVNWVDGMKLRQKHFSDSQDHLTDAIRDVASCYITDVNYGLLPVLDKKQRTKGMFSVRENEVKVTEIIIRDLHAITPDGSRIDIDNMEQEVSSIAGYNKDSVGDYFLLVIANAFERIPFGSFDPDEVPPRMIYARARYHFCLMPAGSNRQEVDANALIIGKLHTTGSEITVAEDYIPPCTSVKSLDTLATRVEALREDLFAINVWSQRIVEKILMKESATSLSQSIKTTCASMRGFFAEKLFYFRNIVPHMPPVFMIEVINALAYKIYAEVRLLKEQDKVEMLQYFREWGGVEPHELLSSLEKVIDINYDHNNIDQHLADVLNVVDKLKIIWSKLCTLDYIGQRKENIVLKEEQLTGVSTDTKGYAILG